MIWVWEIAELVLVRAICAIHAKVFAENKKIGKFFHLIWFLVNAIPFTVIALVSRHPFWLVCFALLRFVFYNPVLNFLRSPRRSFFYLGDRTQSTESWYDKIEESVLSAWPYIWCFGLVLFIVSQVIEIV